MKAVIIERYGEPEVLKMKNIEKPSPKPDEVLIKIKATAVTASDVLIRSLKVPFFYRLMVQLIFGFGRPRNPILGMVASGIIAEKGKDVTKFKVGDEVFAYCSMPPLKLIDAVGKSKSSTLKVQSKRAINRGGRYLSIDDGTPKTPPKAFMALKELVEQGKLKAVIDSIYPLEDVVEAHRYVEGGHKRGSVVLSVQQ